MKLYNINDLTSFKCNNIVLGATAVIGIIGGIYLLTQSTRAATSRIAERKIVKKKKDGQSLCNVCFTQIDTDDSETCIACYSCAKNVCRGEKCSEWVPKDGEWRCQLCAARRDSYGKASSWVQEQYAVKRASLTEFCYPMRARSEIYIPLCDPNESAFLCNFESVSEVPSPINPNQKQHIREYIEEVLADMIGGSLENATVERMSTNNIDYQQVRNGQELQGISNVRLRRLIESIIAETIRQPPFASAGLITTNAIDSNDVDHRETSLPLNGNHCNGNGGQYFESKKYHDLLATAVLNKIVSTHGNGRHSESSPDLTSSSVFDNNHNALNLNKTDESISSSSSVEPRSESSLTDPIRSINKDDDLYDDNANDTIEADRESVLSDFISSHMVPLPHISAEPASEEDEDEEDYISVASSRDANWEDNWLFKKKKSNKTSASVGMLVPAPKEDIRALIGDKPTDEVSDLSELGSDTDDSSLEMVSASLEPLNDRLVNKHLIGGKNTKIVLDELVDRSSMISTSSLPENVPPYTETKNEFVVSNDGLNESESLKISVNNCNKPVSNEAINANVTKSIPAKSEKLAKESQVVSEDETIVPPPNDFTDDEKMRNLLAKFNEEQNNKTDSGDDNSSSLSPRSSISCALSAGIDRAEMDAYEGITDFCVEDEEGLASEIDSAESSSRRPSVIEILAAIALGPMLAVSASDDRNILTELELSSLMELNELAMAQLNSKATEERRLGVIAEESFEIGPGDDLKIETIEGCEDADLLSSPKMVMDAIRELVGKDAIRPERNEESSITIEEITEESTETAELDESKLQQTPDDSDQLKKNCVNSAKSEKTEDKIILVKEVKEECNDIELENTEEKHTTADVVQKATEEILSNDPGDAFNINENKNQEQAEIEDTFEIVSGEEETKTETHTQCKKEARENQSEQYLLKNELEESKTSEDVIDETQISEIKSNDDDNVITVNSLSDDLGFEKIIPENTSSISDESLHTIGSSSEYSEDLEGDATSIFIDEQRILVTAELSFDQNLEQLKEDISETLPIIETESTSEKEKTVNEFILPPPNAFCDEQLKHEDSENIEAVQLTEAHIHSETVQAESQITSEESNNEPEKTAVIEGETHNENLCTDNKNEPKVIEDTENIGVSEIEEITASKEVLCQNEKSEEPPDKQSIDDIVPKTDVESSLECVSSTEPTPNESVQKSVIEAKIKKEEITPKDEEDHQDKDAKNAEDSPGKTIEQESENIIEEQIATTIVNEPSALKILSEAQVTLQDLNSDKSVGEKTPSANSIEEQNSALVYPQDDIKTQSNSTTNSEDPQLNEEEPAETLEKLTTECSNSEDIKALQDVTVQNELEDNSIAEKISSENESCEPCEEAKTEKIEIKNLNADSESIKEIAEDQNSNSPDDKLDLAVAEIVNSPVEVIATKSEDEVVEKSTDTVQSDESLSEQKSNDLKEVEVSSGELLTEAQPDLRLSDTQNKDFSEEVSSETQLEEPITDNLLDKTIETDLHEDQSKSQIEVLMTENSPEKNIDTDPHEHQSKSIEDTQIDESNLKINNVSDDVAPSKQSAENLQTETVEEVTEGSSNKLNSIEVESEPNIEVLKDDAKTESISIEKEVDISVAENSVSEELSPPPLNESETVTSDETRVEELSPPPLNEAETVTSAETRVGEQNMKMQTDQETVEDIDVNKINAIPETDQLNSDQASPKNDELTLISSEKSQEVETEKISHLTANSIPIKECSKEQERVEAVAKEVTNALKCETLPSEQMLKITDTGKLLPGNVVEEKTGDKECELIPQALSEQFSEVFENEKKEIDEEIPIETDSSNPEEPTTADIASVEPIFATRNFDETENQNQNQQASVSETAVLLDAGIVRTAKNLELKAPTDNKLTNTTCPVDDSVSDIKGINSEVTEVIQPESILIALALVDASNEDNSETNIVQNTETEKTEETKASIESSETDLEEKPTADQTLLSNEDAETSVEEKTAETVPEEESDGLKAESSEELICKDLEKNEIETKKTNEVSTVENTEAEPYNDVVEESEEAPIIEESISEKEEKKCEESLPQKEDTSAEGLITDKLDEIPHTQGLEISAPTEEIRIECSSTQSESTEIKLEDENDSNTHTETVAINHSEDVKDKTKIQTICEPPSVGEEPSVDILGEPKLTNNQIKTDSETDNDRQADIEKSNLVKVEHQTDNKKDSEEENLRTEIQLNESVDDHVTESFKELVNTADKAENDVDSSTVVEENLETSDQEEQAKFTEESLEVSTESSITMQSASVDYTTSEEKTESVPITCTDTEENTQKQKINISKEEPSNEPSETPKVEEEQSEVTQKVSTELVQAEKSLDDLDSLEKVSEVKNLDNESSEKANKSTNSETVLVGDISNVSDMNIEIQENEHPDKPAEENQGSKLNEDQSSITQIESNKDVLLDEKVNSPEDLSSHCEENLTKQIVEVEVPEKQDAKTDEVVMESVTNAEPISAEDVNQNIELDAKEQTTTKEDDNEVEAVVSNETHTSEASKPCEDLINESSSKIEETVSQTEILKSDLVAVVGNTQLDKISFENTLSTTAENIVPNLKTEECEILCKNEAILAEEVDKTSADNYEVEETVIEQACNVKQPKRDIENTNQLISAATQPDENTGIPISDIEATKENISATNFVSNNSVVETQKADPEYKEQNTEPPVKDLPEQSTTSEETIEPDTTEVQSEIEKSETTETKPEAVQTTEEETSAKLSCETEEKCETQKSEQIASEERHEDTIKESEEKDTTPITEDVEHILVLGEPNDTEDTSKEQVIQTISQNVLEETHSLNEAATKIEIIPENHEGHSTFEVINAKVSEATVEINTSTSSEIQSTDVKIPAEEVTKEQEKIKVHEEVPKKEEITEVVVVKEPAEELNSSPGFQELTGKEEILTDSKEVTEEEESLKATTHFVEELKATHKSEEKEIKEISLEENHDSATSLIQPTDSTESSLPTEVVSKLDEKISELTSSAENTEEELKEDITTDETKNVGKKTELSKPEETISEEKNKLPSEEVCVVEASSKEDILDNLGPKADTESIKEAPILKPEVQKAEIEIELEVQEAILHVNGLTLKTDDEKINSIQNVSESTLKTDDKKIEGIEVIKPAIEEPKIQEEKTEINPTALDSETKSTILDDVHIGETEHFDETISLDVTQKELDTNESKNRTENIEDTAVQDDAGSEATPTVEKAKTENINEALTPDFKAGKESAPSDISEDVTTLIEDTDNAIAAKLTQTAETEHIDETISSGAIQKEITSELETNASPSLTENIEDRAVQVNGVDSEETPTGERPETKNINEALTTDSKVIKESPPLDISEDVTTLIEDTDNAIAAKITQTAEIEHIDETVSSGAIQKEKTSELETNASPSLTKNIEDRAVQVNDVDSVETPTGERPETENINEALTTDSKVIKESPPLDISEDVTALTEDIPKQENAIEAEITQTEEDAEASKSEESSAISEVTQLVLEKVQSEETVETKPVLDVSPEVSNTDEESKVLRVSTEELLQEKALAEEEKAIPLQKVDALQSAGIAETKELPLLAKLEDHQNEATVDNSADKFDTSSSAKLAETSQLPESILDSKNETVPLEKLEEELCKSVTTSPQQIDEVTSSHDSSSCSDITPIVEKDATKEESFLNQSSETEEPKLQEDSKEKEIVLSDEKITVSEELISGTDKLPKTEEPINDNSPINTQEVDNYLPGSTIEKESAVEEEREPQKNDLKEISDPIEQKEDNSIPGTIQPIEVIEDLNSRGTSSEDTAISEKVVSPIEISEESKTQEVETNIEAPVEIVDTNKITIIEVTASEEENTNSLNHQELSNLTKDEIMVKDAVLTEEIYLAKAESLSKPNELSISDESGLDLKEIHEQKTISDSISAEEETNIKVHNVQDPETKEEEKPVETVLGTTIEENNNPSTTSEDIQKEIKLMEQTAVEASDITENLSVQEELREVKDDPVETTTVLVDEATPAIAVNELSKAEKSHEGSPILSEEIQTHNASNVEVKENLSFQEELREFKDDPVGTNMEETAVEASDIKENPSSTSEDIQEETKLMEQTAIKASDIIENVSVQEEITEVKNDPVQTTTVLADEAAPAIEVNESSKAEKSHEGSPILSEEIQTHNASNVGVKAPEEMDELSIPQKPVLITEDVKKEVLSIQTATDITSIIEESTTVEKTNDESNSDPLNIKDAPGQVSEELNTNSRIISVPDDIKLRKDSEESSTEQDDEETDSEDSFKSAASEKPTKSKTPEPASEDIAMKESSELNTTPAEVIIQASEVTHKQAVVSEKTGDSLTDEPDKESKTSELSNSKDLDVQSGEISINDENVEEVLKSEKSLTASDDAKSEVSEVDVFPESKDSQKSEKNAINEQAQAKLEDIEKSSITESVETENTIEPASESKDTQIKKQEIQNQEIIAIEATPPDLIADNSQTQTLPENSEYTPETVPKIQNEAESNATETILENYKTKDIVSSVEKDGSLEKVPTTENEAESNETDTILEKIEVEKDGSLHTKLDTNSKAIVSKLEELNLIEETTETQKVAEAINDEIETQNCLPCYENSPKTAKEVEKVIEESNTQIPLLECKNALVIPGEEQTNLEEKTDNIVGGQKKEESPSKEELHSSPEETYEKVAENIQTENDSVDKNILTELTIAEDPTVSLNDKLKSSKIEEAPKKTIPEFSQEKIVEKKEVLEQITQDETLSTEAVKEENDSSSEEKITEEITAVSISPGSVSASKDIPEVAEEVQVTSIVKSLSTELIPETSQSSDTIPAADTSVQSESENKSSEKESVSQEVSKIATLQGESNKFSAETVMAENAKPIQDIDGAQISSEPIAATETPKHGNKIESDSVSAEEEVHNVQDSETKEEEKPVETILRTTIEENKPIAATETPEPKVVDKSDEEKKPAVGSKEQTTKQATGVAMAEDKLSEVINEQVVEVEEIPPIEVLTATCKIITHPPLQPTESLIESAQFLYDKISQPISETTREINAPSLAEELRMAADRNNSKESSTSERVIPQNIACESRCFTPDPQQPTNQLIASDSVAIDQQLNAQDAAQGNHISQVAKQLLFAEQSTRKSKVKNSGSKFRNLTLRDRRFLAELEKRRKQRELIQNYLDSLDCIDTPSYLNEDLYLFESKCSIERSPYSLFIEPPEYCIVGATSTSSTAKTHFLKTNILFSDRISSESNGTDDSTTTVIDTFGSMGSRSSSDSGEEFSPDDSTDRDSSATATTANNSIITTNKATNQSHIYSPKPPPPQPQPELRTESACSKLHETRTTGGNAEHVDDDPLKHLVPGSIAEREYKKWYNAVEMPNNPYSVEALRRRLSGGPDRAFDLPNISPCSEENPLQLCESPAAEAENKGQQRDYSRYSRDYYINDAKQASGATKKSPTSPPQISSPTSTTSSIELIERVENNKKTVETTPVKEMCHKLEKQCRIEADIYLATPVQVIEDIPQAFADKNPIEGVGTITSLTTEAVSKLSSETSSNLTNESLTPSEDSDTIRIYDLKKQETRLIKESTQTTTTTTTITVPKSPEKKVRPTELEIMPTLAPPIATVSSKCSTPTSFKFLQPKRKLINPSQVLSIDLDTSPITPATPDKPVIEAEVVHAMPSVKALAKAFLMTSSTSSSENRWRKARAKSPLQFFKPTTPTVATAATNLTKVLQKHPEQVIPDTTSQGSEDATIASDLSSLETDPPSRIDGDTLDSNASEDRALSPVVLSGCLRNNIAFFENLKNK